MRADTQRAAELMRNGGYTCVLCREGTVFSSAERGVKPLLQLLDSGRNLHGFCAADKVVGRAAASIYALLGAAEVYSPVMTEAAEAILSKAGIQAVYDSLVKTVMNRRGDGICPMEEATAGARTPAEALLAIRLRLEKLK